MKSVDELLSELSATLFELRDNNFKRGLCDKAQTLVGYIRFQLKKSK